MAATESGEDEAAVSGCCAPYRATDSKQGTRRPPEFRTERSVGGRSTGMVEILGGEFLIGADDELSYPADGEGPVHEVSLSPYQIDALTVTNDDFAAFIGATNYETDAERIGWSFVFAGLLPDDFPPTRASAGAPWWRQVMSADWRRPEGPQSCIEGRADHPVVHVSWSDACTYAAWCGKTLPTEAQWERAARGEREQARFPWGGDLTPGGQHRMNVWQGRFPVRNTQDDGWYGTCPANTFPANDFGLHNTTGNVWEWCADWFDVYAHRTNPRRDPQGPTSGTQKLLKGGSFLCHASYCARYRPAARIGLPPDTSTSHIGFRCARPSAEPGAGRNIQR